MLKESDFRPYGVESRARPCRLAFFVDPENCPPMLLDTLFRSNYGLWGGRFNPLIPVRKGVISDPYWSLLRRVDPDILYIHTSLPETLIKRLDNELAPLRFEAHHEDLRKNPPFYPQSYGQALVRSAQMMPLLLTKRPLVGPKAKVLTYAASWTWPHLQFVARNFGVLREQYMPHLPEGTESLPIQDNWNLAELFEHLAGNAPNLVFPFQASEAYSEFPQPATQQETNYCVLIGDSVETWIHFWNRIFSLPQYIRSGWNTLCLPKIILANESLDEPLRKFIHKFAHRSSSGLPLVAFEFLECDEHELKAFSERLLKGLNIHPRVKTPGTDEFIANQQQPLFHLGWNASRTTHQQAVAQDSLLSPPNLPVSQTFGNWMMDLRIQYIPQVPFYTNEILSWELPKRTELAEAFVEGHPSRVGQTPTISIEMQHINPFRLRRPSEQEMFYRIVDGARARSYGEDLQIKVEERRFGRVSASDKALYVNGIIELFGGLQHAGRFLEHSFWRNVFEQLSMRGAQSEAKLLDRVQNKLAKHKSTIISQLNTGSKSIEWLSRLVLQLAHEHRSDEPAITFAELKDQFHSQREQYITQDPGFRPVASDKDIERDREEATKDLEGTFQWLVDNGILLQGIGVRCINCGSRYWREMSVIRQQLTCEGCGATIHTSIEPTWRYKLNSLVRNGIALHGCVPVIVALYYLRKESKNAFLYIPGMALYKNEDDERPEAEVDIAYIADHQLACGEVKSRASEFTSTELKKLANIAHDLRADRIVIFAFRDEQQLMAGFKQQLDGIVHAGCEVTAFAASEFAFDPKPHA